MTYFPFINMAVADCSARDAFGALRVSAGTTIFDSQNQFNKSPFLWEEVLTGAASTTHLPNESSVRLDVTTASGDKVIRQTHEYFRYQPGKSLRLVFTAVPGVQKTNVRQRWGYFDANNGIFFEQDGSNLKVVRRTFVSGAAVDTVVNQSSWNIDPLDGTGPSAATLDLSKANIFVIDFQWLGAGRVRIGVDIGGSTFYCHQFMNANNLSSVYMTTANLPLRFELENTGVAASSTSMIQICAVVISEAGFEADRGLPFAAGNNITPISVTTRRPILSIRPRLTFNSITNRGPAFHNLELWLRAATNDCMFELVYGGLPSRITLTGAAWNNVDTNNSSFEFDVAATAISGGTTIHRGYLNSGGGSQAIVLSHNFLERLTLGLDIAGTTQDILSIVCTSFSGTSSDAALLNWHEIY